ncbi:hypothetical protein HDV00_005578 [Rhizophlyctis rosea]|nr:hypothetical protein HDV00_005578 [Rhizophlyctis rosea]
MSQNWNWNVALITGGAGGLGRAIAEFLVKRGKKVIIAGRTESSLKQTASEIGAEYITVDVGKADSLAQFVQTATTRFPDIDCIIANAGIQKPIDYKSDPTSVLKTADEEIDINIRGTVHLIAQFLPHLLSKPSAAVMTVSSGLAFVPIPNVPIYCATKAFIHSYSITLRIQLKGTPVRVIEIAPPLVESDLHRDHPNPDGYTKEKMPFALTQAEFIADVERDMDAGEDVVAPGFCRTRVRREYEAFKEDFDRLNGPGH